MTLAPFMIVAGDHANNDMAGDEDDAWKTMLEKVGYEVSCVFEGTWGDPCHSPNLYRARFKGCEELKVMREKSF